MVDRHSTKSQRLALKAATRAQVDAGGGCMACVEHSRIKRFQAFSEYGQSTHENFIAIDIAVDLMQESGEVHILRAMARAVGCEVIELPNLPNGFTDLQIAMGKSAKEFGEVISSIGVHISDGKWDHKERQADLKEIDDAILALLALRNLAERGQGDE
ncbi:hypothetical protein O4H47_16835 [Maritalea porphyrae]|nr:hypothetical protein [Maritalea porphyrae]